MARYNAGSLEGEFDLLIVGAGITGAGAARDAARRGLRVIVVDQDDVASGTSSRSSKLVHGGLRYLEQGEVSLVFEAVAERRVLQQIAPHLVNPIPFLLPVYKNSRRGMFTINVGMWLYDGLSLFRSPKMHESLSRKEVLKVEPALRSEGLRGAPVYYDCATNDARLTLETVLDAVKAGAVVRTHTQVTRLIRDKGAISGAVVRDRLTGEEFTIQAHVVLNATGPWSDRTCALTGDDEPDRLRPTKGIHLVVNSERLKVTHAIVGLHPSDGRVFFTIPWGEQTYIGTTDTDFEGDPADVYADADDVAYVLNASNEHFPQVNLTVDDVISTWAGVRPLVSEEAAEHESSVSREHVIRVGMDGLVTIAGGKLTTYRRMGAEVIDRVIDVLRGTGHRLEFLRAAETDLNPLPGAIGWPEGDDHAAVAKRVLAAADGLIDERTAVLLSDTYGMRGIDIAESVAKDPDLATPLVPGRPEIRAQVMWGIEKELACTVSDIMIRRTQLYYRDADQGLSALDTVAEMMAVSLGWNEPDKTRSVQDYREEVERSRRWRAG
jgi:glycerol-3-phosphate dehydrogenase